MLKGKQGRFRQNLLGKRVDYSGRSVIVVGPTLKLHQCGLPKLMALELFKPFVMKRLVETEVAQNIKSAKRMVERRKPQVWDVLEGVIREHPVLLNRAPTLHRLGIQAFEPVLVEGKAIQVHPLVCTAFNADFDGDQMAVHVPLSAEAQAEARVLMLSANNILSPGDGPADHGARPGHGLRRVLPDARPDETRPRRRGRSATATRSRPRSTEGSLRLHDVIELRAQPDTAPRRAPRARGHRAQRAGHPRRGHDAGAPLVQRGAARGVPLRERPRSAVARPRSAPSSRRSPRSGASRTSRPASTGSSRSGFRYASQSGLTISIDDVVTPPEKQEILERYEHEAEKAEAQYQPRDHHRRGAPPEGGRDLDLGELRGRPRPRADPVLARPFNPIDMMVDSGARGNSQQIRQIAGMKGLVSNPRGEMIPRPIKSSFREGLSVLEYFISTHGTRKGLADTALRTADSGYLTRRLVDVAQELIVKVDDCGTARGIWLDEVVADTPGRRAYLETRAYGRVLAEPVEPRRRLRDRRRARCSTTSSWRGSATTRRPTASACARRSPARPSTASAPSATASRSRRAGSSSSARPSGVIAAQSIGEPGTQLTMRTFHAGGVAESDITHGLPRVVELFEARTPEGRRAARAALGHRPRRGRRGRPQGHRRRRRRHAPGRGHPDPCAPRRPRRRRRSRPATRSSRARRTRRSCST